MNYYLALSNYYARNVLAVALTVMVSIPAIAVMLLNMVVRLEWLVDVFADTLTAIKKVKVLKPVGPDFKSAVKFWKKHLDMIDRNFNNFEHHTSIQQVLVKHCSGKPAGYVGFKYLRAVRYSHDRLVKNMKNNTYFPMDKW